MTKPTRVELYRRLPEIYRIKDEDLPKLYLQDGQPVPAYQLKNYLEPAAEMFSAIHENIESLYHDFFIEYCDGWVIPYIGDLLGTTHLSGDEWTLRADVADTIALRRRKGTLGAIELLAYILTTWGVHSVELLENMVWNQHLNHQRPDEGGAPPYGLPTVKPSAPIRGGTVSLRDPSLLAQLGSPFDPFAHVADVKPADGGEIAYNLPNLAIFLWRLKDYRLDVTRPHMKRVPQVSGAPHVVRVNVDYIPVNALSAPYVKAQNTPAGRPMTLFNTNRLDLIGKRRTGADALNLAAIAPRISSADQVPGPMPVERISDDDIAQAYDASLASPTPQPLEVFAKASFTAPQEYVAVESYDETAADLSTLQIADVGLQLHLPESMFPGERWPHTALPRDWTIRGENLCAWELGLVPPLGSREIAIDPERGRLCIGLPDQARADALVSDLLVTFTYGAPGPVGAHPVSRPPLPRELDAAQTPAVIFATVSFRDPARQLQAVVKKALQDARAIVAGAAPPPPAIVVEITDSRSHPFDPAALDPADINAELGTSVLLECPLIIRAADGERPVIELARPLAFRPAKIAGATPAEQTVLDARIEALFVRLEGLYVARALNYGAGLPLISRTALNRLEVLGCTLDPGGFGRYDGSRAPLLPAMNLREPYGFATPADELAFTQTPEINVQRSVCGAICADEGYRLCLEDSIVESIPVVAGGVTLAFAISDATAPATGYAGATTIRNVTVLGRVRAFSATGAGGIFTGAVEAFDQQTGCLKQCYFAGVATPGSVPNRLPPHFACVFGDDARLIFTSERFGDPAYCQLSLGCDARILDEGVDMDQMGAFNFLREAHKWSNLRIRLREFMPVGVRPLLISVT
jgi:hypothetical protein